MSRSLPSARAVRWTVGAVLVLVVVGGLAWVAVTGLMARREVAATKAGLEQLRHDIDAGRSDRARADAQVVRRHAERAHSLTSGPAWWAAAGVPWLGAPLRTVRVASTQVGILGQDVLPGLLKAEADLRPAASGSDHRIDLAALDSAAPVVHRGARATDAALSAVADLPHHTWLSSVDRARATLASQLTDIAQTLDRADRVTGMLPRLLGRDGPRRYFLGLENEAESRGLGGLPGSYAIAVADHGAIHFTHFGSDTELNGVRADVELTRDERALYAQADPTGTYVNSDLSPDFPMAARIWAAMYEQKTGQHIDGAIAVDPTALSYLLAASGPATLPDGESVSADNVVQLTEKDAYSRFPANAQRKAFLNSVTSAAENQLLAAGINSAMISAVARATDERRLLVWSADSALEKQLAGMTAGGVLQARGHPFTGFVVSNAAGSKLDYYLHRSMSYTRTGCGDTRQATARFTLTNAAPASGLPAYVTTRADDPAYATRPGDNRLVISYYGTPGSTVASVTVDGKPLTVATGRENGLVVVTFGLELPVGSTHTVVIHLREPAAHGSVQILRQPLVQPMQVTAHAAVCP